jgi:N-acetylmuramoyl-L-alanine amidase
MRSRCAVIILLVVASLCVPVVEAAAQSAQTLYSRALARERTLRDGARKPTLKQLRAAVASYEALVRRYPASGYSDNALWQAANLSLLAYDEFNQTSDRSRGLRLLGLLRSEYLSSSLVARATAIARQRETAATAPPPPPPASGPPPVVAAAPAPARAAVPRVAIRDVKRTTLPEGVRVTLEMDGEASFHAERIDNPRRLFFDLKNATAAASLRDATLKFDDTLVREVRFGRHPGATRVVMDMEGAESYSVFTLYDPFRLVVDFTRDTTSTPRPIPVSEPASAEGPKLVTAPPPAAPTVTTPQLDASEASDTVPTSTRSAIPPVPPSAPSANADGKFSLARQLGLGVSRIVIDAGHGGHDPGAKANGLTESELTLDIALRLRKLLEKQPGVEVVMTRATNVFIPLEERTRIANREGADLFLSIHANASRNAQARGVETYFLNFATNPDAQAVAARENAGSSQSMHKLPDIVRAIALNNKIDESRDFADMVQQSMVRRLSTRNKALRDIGVKQAPFVVLIGAGMPSVLAEMSFLTNKQDAALLKTGAYRQQIAEALLDAVLRYQQSLKKMRSASSTAQTR